MMPEERRQQILDELHDAIFGPPIPAHAFTAQMASEKWDCSKEYARQKLCILIKEGKLMRGKSLKSQGYWYWPVEDDV